MHLFGLRGRRVPAGPDGQHRLVRLARASTRGPGIAEIEGQYIGPIKLSAEGARLFRGVFDDTVSGRKAMNRPPERAFMTDFLQFLVDQGIPVWPVPVHGRWLEIDSPKDVALEATRDRLRQVTRELETKRARA